MTERVIKTTKLDIHEAQWEVFRVEFIGVLMVLLRNLCISVFFQQQSEKFSGFLIEFITLIFPMLFCLTIFSEHLNTFIFSIILACIILALIQVTLDRSLYYLTRYTDYFSYFRNAMFIGTAVAILAFDFHVFPHRFGKTHTYGVSVMDIGTAMFVVSMAISEYIIAKRPQKTKSNKKSNSMCHLPIFAILLLIGLLRELFAHIFNYGHSIIEYGEHWNFFMTLGCLKLFTTIFPYPYSIPIGIALGIVYQGSLNLGLEDWIMRKDRDSSNIFDSNREGICSLFGYIFIYCLTLVVIRVMAIVDGIFNPSHKSVLICFFSAAIVYMMQLLAMPFFGEPSRRMANVPYVLSMLCMKLAVLGLFQLIQLYGVLKTDKPTPTSTPRSLTLLEAISTHCLWFFLIANICTGLVNLMINTHKVDNLLLQMTILIAYNFVICLIIYLWHLYQNRPKFSKDTTTSLSSVQIQQ